MCASMLLPQSLEDTIWPFAFFIMTTLAVSAAIVLALRFMWI